MKLVKDFYQNVRIEHGQKTAREFLRLMEQWDGSRTVYYAFYSSDVLNMMLNEAMS